MTKEKVKEWIEIGLELQFEHKGIGYYMCPIWDKRNHEITGIFFCQDYHDDICLKVKDVDELWASEYRGLKVSDILDSVPEDQVDGRV